MKSLTQTVRHTAMAAMTMICFAMPAYAAPEIGKLAPEFTGTDTNGVEHSLSDFRGKNVILEWTNTGCPFVQKHYSSGNMQKLQKQAAAEDIVWLSIVSSGKGQQGYSSGDEANAWMKEAGSEPTARILDPSGEIGHMYDAKTTPHMFVIDAEGIVRYMGAIDSNPSPNPDTIDTAENYVMNALHSLENGEDIAEPVTRPYGCSVKYSTK